MQPKENESQPFQKNNVPMAPTVYIGFPDKSGVIVAFREIKDSTGKRSLGECKIEIHSPVAGMYDKPKRPCQAESWAEVNWSLLETIRHSIGEHVTSYL